MERNPHDAPLGIQLFKFSSITLKDKPWQCQIGLRQRSALLKVPFFCFGMIRLMVQVFVR
jgi:hypothetical protein